jgi:hypothetical protein
LIVFLVGFQAKPTHWAKWFALATFWFVKLSQDFFGNFWVWKVRKRFLHVPTLIAILQATSYDSF